MVAILIRPTEPGDAESLAPRLRPADLAEVAAGSLRTPLEELRAGVAATPEPLTVADDADRAVAMFGVFGWDGLPGVGLVWMLGAPEVVADRRWFLRESRAWVQQEWRRWGALVAAVDARYAASLRWLAWLGFTEADRSPHPATGMPHVLLVRTLQRAKVP